MSVFEWTKELGKYASFLEQVGETHHARLCRKSEVVIRNQAREIEALRKLLELSALNRDLEALVAMDLARKRSKAQRARTKKPTERARRREHRVAQLLGISSQDSQEERRLLAVAYCASASSYSVGDRPLKSSSSDPEPTD